MEVLWDTIYGSFVFKPLQVSEKTTVHRGRVMDDKGKPARSQRVDLTLGSRTLHTFTDRDPCQPGFASR